MFRSVGGSALTQTCAAAGIWILVTLLEYSRQDHYYYTQQ